MISLINSDTTINYCFDIDTYNILNNIKFNIKLNEWKIIQLFWKHL